MLMGATDLAQPAAPTQALWQTNAAGHDLHIIDVSTRTVVKRLVVGPQPHGLAVPDDARVVYVSLEANAQRQGELLWVDPQTYAITQRLPVGREPHAIATTPDGRWVYVPCRDGHYWVVDAHQHHVLKKIYTGGRPHNTQASRDGRYMYLSPMGAPQRVTIVDVAAGHQVVGTLPFGASLRPPALAADNTRLYQHVDGLNGFQVADIQARQVLVTVRHTHSLGWLLLPGLARLGWFHHDGFHRCHGLAIRPDQQEIWSVCGTRVTVHRLTPAGWPETADIPLRDDGYWVTFTPESTYGFIALSGANTVAMVDAQTKAVLTHVAVGQRPKRNIVIPLTGNAMARDQAGSK
jgi:DNA-binding beta-propeller fold protein YncE